MKYVRLQNNIVQEIIPDYALPVEKWYGAEFAAQCVEAPDTVTQGMVYDPDTKTFLEAPALTASSPTATERNRADIDYLAAMTGVSLE